MALETRLRLIFWLIVAAGVLTLVSGFATIMSMRASAAARTHFEGEAVLVPSCDPIAMHVGCSESGRGAWRIMIDGKTYTTRQGFTATLEP